MSLELCIGGARFWERLTTDLASAKQSAYVQALTFEADAAGLPLADALVRLEGLDRRVLMDEFFTLHKINDRFLHWGSARHDEDLRAEARGTLAMIERMRAAGVGVKVVNPSGRIMHRVLNRSHKKIVAIDERVAYVGGINFSEHNFAWHDLMLRIDRPEVARWLADDFRASWEGRPRPGHARFGDLELLSLDGHRNPETLAPLVDAFRGARRNIVVHSPYLSPPFTDLLADARHRGVSVTVLTAGANNWPAFQNAMLHRARRGHFAVRLLPERMSHMKAALIDDELLVLGSVNFDALSYWTQEEVLVLARDAGLVEQFRKLVLEPDLAASRPPEEPISRALGAAASAVPRMYAMAAKGYWRARLRGR